MIPYGRQDITEEDIAAINGVLRSNFLTQGPMIPEFENAVATHCNAKFGVATSNATAALHIACLALGVEPGDEVWTSPITFVASANCALYCGADVRFIDIDPDTFNMCPKKLNDQLKLAREEKRLPKVVIPVHMCGQPCDMEAIWNLAKEYGFKVIEDASHAIGASYQGEPVGSCRYSDVTVFSFHPVKIVTTAEGGMATTNDPALADRMATLRTHGITRDPHKLAQNHQQPWYYEQQDLGFNYRLTDIQAALGLSQMKRLETYIAKRRDIASQYAERMADFDIDLPVERENCESSFHLYVIRTKSERPKARLRLFHQLREMGIGVNVHYIPVYHQPYYQKRYPAIAPLEVAETYYQRCISLPMFPMLTSAEIDRVVNSVGDALRILDAD